MVDFNREGSGRQFVDPKLLALMDKANGKEGINIKDLKKGDVVEVVTKNHIYTLKVIDPAEVRVEATSNGPHLSGPIITYVSTTLTGTGTMIKVGHLMVGYSICFGNLVTSTCQEIRVNGKKVLPK